MRHNVSTHISGKVSAKGCRWHIPEPTKNNVLAQIVVNRGLDETSVERLIHAKLSDDLPDPNIMTDMSVAVDVIADAMARNASIVVYGDYDVDGATSSAIIRRYMAMAGHKNLEAVIPNREYGYGFGADSAELILKNPPEVLLLLDCGTHNHDTIADARFAGCRVVVIDHHMPGNTLPFADALVNPHRHDECDDAKVLRILCTAGLAFMFTVACNRELRRRGYWNAQRPEPQIASLLDLAALGTVCDVMPLIGLNRTLVKLGLKHMRSRSNLGLDALCTVAGVREDATVTSLGFHLGPRINAGGRIGQARLGSDLLTSTDRNECMSIATALDGLNKDRQAIEKAVKTAAEAMVDPNDPIIIVAGDGWHEGVIGIVASRLKEQFRKPTIVMSIAEDGSVKGSGRSIEGLNLGEAILNAKAAGMLTAGGGHTMACGLSTNIEGIAPFKAHMIETCGDIARRAKENDTTKTDGAIWTNDITTGLVTDMDSLGPWGQAWPRPKFVIGPCRAENVRKTDGGHIFCQLRDDNGTIKAKLWRAAENDMEAILTSGKSIYAMVTLENDTWNGRVSSAATIEDLIAS